MSEEKPTVVIADKDQVDDEKSHKKDVESDSSDGTREITPIAGIKRPAESQLQDSETNDKEEEGHKEAKPTFKFRPATLQSGPAEKTYTDNSQSWSGGSVGSSGFILQPSKLSTPSSSGSLFKLDISHPNLTLSTASPSLSTGLLTNKSDDNNTSDKKNIFLQFLSTTSSSTQSSNGNFLFGSNLQDKVAVKSEQTNSDDVTSEKDDENKDASTNSNNVVFGNTSAPENLPEIQRITGEEEEENIMQISAKMYVFDTTSHSWKERGRGELHLNDSHQSTSPILQSRIVMRCSGTYKVLLNTHIWPQMMCELADRKSLRISAQDTDFKVKVFLIVSNPKHTLSLHNALLKRITQLASVQQSSDAEESSGNKTSDAEESSENKTESNPTSNTEHESPS